MQSFIMFHIIYNMSCKKVYSTLFPIPHERGLLRPRQNEVVNIFSLLLYTKPVYGQEPLQRALPSVQCAIVPSIHIVVCQ